MTSGYEINSTEQDVEITSQYFAPKTLYSEIVLLSLFVSFSSALFISFARGTKVHEKGGGGGGGGAEGRKKRDAQGGGRVSLEL